MVSLEGSLKNVDFYCLNTVGTVNMLLENGVSKAVYSDNVNTYADTIALFQVSALAGSGGTTSSSSTSTSISSTSKLNISFHSLSYFLHLYSFILSR